MSKKAAGSAQHESFQIHDEQANGRIKLVRQDRIEVDSDNCWLERVSEPDSVRYRVLNYNPFGLALETREPLAVGLCLSGFSLIYENTEVGELQLRVVRCERQDAQRYNIGVTVEMEPLNIERMRAVGSARKVVNSVESSFNRYHNVPAAFKAHVYQFKDWLEFLQDKINLLSAEMRGASLAETQVFEDTVSQVVGAFLTEQLHPLYDELAATLKNSSPADLKLSFEFFRKKLESLVYQAPFAERSYRKPLGYAGDFEMMNLIYRNEPAGHSLFAKCLNRYFVTEPAARAVRNRSDYLALKINETFWSRKNKKSLKFLSVASGPAYEIAKFFNNCNDFRSTSAEFHFLDQDLYSLKFAQRNLEVLRRDHNLSFGLKPVHRAIKNVIVDGVGDEGYDLVYSAGLFDYFSDPVAQMAAQRLFAAVAPGGRLIIGNFNTYNPTRFLMELALDWTLLYRSEDDLKRIFAGLGGEVTVEQEETAINLFCVIRKRE